jgi:hypothetical protein
VNKLTIIKKQLGHLFYLLFNAKQYGFYEEEFSIKKDISYYVYFYYAIKDSRCNKDIDETCILEKYKCLCDKLKKNCNLNMDEQLNEQLNELIEEKIETLIPCFADICTNITNIQNTITEIQENDCCDELEGLDERITALEEDTCCEDLDLRVTALEEDTCCEDLEGRVEVLEQTILCPNNFQNTPFTFQIGETIYTFSIDILNTEPDENGCVQTFFNIRIE